MATNPSNSTTPEADQLDPEQPGQHEPEQPEQPDEVPAEPAADPEARGVVIDANGTAWEDTEATRNERAAS